MSGVVYSCPSCGEEMLCSPELAELRAEVERLRAELKDGDDADAGMRELCAALRAEVERLRAVSMIQDEPDSCARCDKTMDGCEAATGDICHDCWQSLEVHAGNAKKLVVAAVARAEAAERVRDDHIALFRDAESECATLRAEVARLGTRARGVRL